MDDRPVRSGEQLRTGDSYPRFGLGCWLFGLAESDEDRRRAVEVITTAYERGVRHFDTARGYGDGVSESIVAQALAGRNDAEVATKSRALGYDETLEAIDDSRRRLGRDRIDLLYVHWPRKGFDIRPMMEALESARAAGRIAAVGVSNFGVADLERAQETARIDVHQIGYSLLWRFAESDVIGYCRRHSIRIYSYSSLAQGLLTGKVPATPDFPDGDPRPTTVFYDADVWPHVYAAVIRMKERAQMERIDLHQAALRWLIDSAGVSRVLVGARTTEQLESTLSSFRVELDASLLVDLQTISDEVHRYLPESGNIFRYYP